MIIYVFLLMGASYQLAGGSQVESSRQPPPLSLLQYETSRQIATYQQNKTLFQNCETCSHHHKSDVYRGRTEQSRRLWTNAEVPYRVSDKSVPDVGVIKEAIAHFEKQTCLRFREIGEGERVKNALYFIKEEGCWSSVGMIGGHQEVSFGEQCNKVEGAIHEIGHAVGLHHEHSRSDRDQYVVVFPENMIPHMRFVLDKTNDSNYDVPYDYTSIMHYQLDGFSKDPLSKKTLTPFDPLNAYLIQERNRLSFRDVQLLNTMYKCNAHCKNELSCQNTGYVGPNCRCLCPPGTTGKRCGKKYHSYYPSNDCGGMVTEEGPLKSPKHSKPLDTERKCIWWIKAPKNNRVQITFRKFDLEGRYVGPTAYFDKKCAWDRLEVRTKNIYQGITYCGEEVKVGDSFTSKNRDLVLEYTSMTPSRQGFGIKIVFIRNNSII